jgi:hypothetical protein
MSIYFMFFIAACYAGAAVSFAIEGKFMWAGLALCWGIGNALTGMLSK